MESSHGNIVVRTFRVAKGETRDGGCHNFHHMTEWRVGSGWVHYHVENDKGKFVFWKKTYHEAIFNGYDATTDFDCIDIDRFVRHSFLADEDSVIRCIYSIRDPLTGEALERWNGNRLAVT